MKHLEMPPADRQLVQQHVKDHTEVLRRNVLASGDHARKYLTLANAGAAVALLTFMGSNPTVRDATAPRISLALFVLGIICVGVLSAFDYHSRAFAARAWHHGTRQFYRNEVDYDAMVDDFNRQIFAREAWPVVFAYVAFGCFVLGCLISIAWFLPCEECAMDWWWVTHRLLPIR